MKNLISICIFVCLLHHGLVSQGWIATYNPTQLEEYNPTVIQTPDGGYVYAAVTRFKPYNAVTMNVVVMKTDANGNEQWSRVLDYIDGNQFGRQLQVFLVLRDQTLIVGADSESGWCYDRPVFWELDLAGNILDLHVIEEEFKMYEMLMLEDGRLALYGTTPHITWPNCYNQNAVIVLDTNFQEAYFSFPAPFSGLPDAPLSLLELDNGDVLGFGEFGHNGFYYFEVHYTTGFYDKFMVNVGGNYNFNDKELIAGKPGFFYLAANGLLQKRRQDDFSVVWSYYLPDLDGYQKIIPTDDGGFFIASAWGDSIHLVRLDSLVNVIWEHDYPVFYPQTGLNEGNGVVHSRVFSVQETFDKGFIIVGHHLPRPDTALKVFLLKIDETGRFGSTLKGKIVLDANGNCTDDNEAAAKSWIVEAKNQTGSYYGTTDASGQYMIQVDTGTYTVTAFYPGSGYFEICNDNAIVILAGAADTISHDIIIRPKVLCPLLQVGSGRNFIRPCIENNYTIQYCNYGSAISADTRIAVILGDYMTFVSSGLPYETSGDTLLFALGDLLPGNCSKFNINILIDCLAPLDSLFCLEIIASPNSICDPSLAGYTGYREKRCLSGVIPFDPNDKTADPQGDGLSHFVKADTVITYKIRFQNTGNDTAFNVFILDALPAQLDISSFVPGASSHDYQWKISDKRVLNFLFKNIMLPDSNVNSEASNGYAMYNIRIGKDEIPRQRFDNHAAIYFDYNEPILTEPAFHTIQAPVIRDSIYTTVCCDEDLSNCDFNADTTIIHFSSYPHYDQITTEFITVSQITETEDQKMFCEGDYIHYGDHTYTEPGIYFQHLSSIAGCDSIVKLVLTQSPLFHVFAAYEICEGDVLHHIVFKEAGQFEILDTLAGDETCDTVSIKSVLVHPVETISEHVVVQAGELYQGVKITHDTLLVNIDTTIHGCTKITNVFVQVITTSVYHAGNEINLTFKPNPFRSQFIIESAAENFTIKNVSVLDCTGRLVPSIFTPIKIGSESDVVIEILRSPPGLYIVCIETVQGISCHKVIKE